jgi:hypothetical protein
MVQQKTRADTNSSGGFLLAVNKDHLSSGLGAGMSPPQASSESEIGDQGFRARDHQQVIFAACSARRRDLALKFFDPDEVLPAAGEQARILRKRLVLDSIMGRPSGGRP